MVATESKPSVLAVCIPGLGHMIPMLQIVEDLVSKGYNVWFLATEAFREQVEKSNAKFLPLLNACNITGLARVTSKLQEVKTGVARYEHWFDNYNPYLKEVWVRPIPAYLESMRRAMTAIRQTYAPGEERELVVLCESFTPAVVALMLGAELPEGYTKRPKSLAISIMPPQVVTLAQGVNLGGDMLTELSGWQGLPYDPKAALTDGSGDLVRSRNALLARIVCAAHAPLWEDLDYVLSICGATEKYQNLMGDYTVPQGPIGLSYLGHDTTLQMCVPSLEYDVSEWPKHVKFGGTLPAKPVDPNFEIPAWLLDVRANGKNGTKTKKVVFTTQGTVAVSDYKPCILPTINGLADREDLVVIATLGVKGLTLDDHFKDGLPANTIVLDYFPYQLVLDHADVVVTNGSYGIYNQCAVHGVPMVLAGSMWEDKPHIANRAQYTGLGLHLRAPEPTAEMVANAVATVTAPGSTYTARAIEIKQEVEDFNCLDTVEKELLKLVRT